MEGGREGGREGGSEGRLDDDACSMEASSEDTY